MAINKSNKLLVRADLNVPIKNGKVLDNFRIKHKIIFFILLLTSTIFVIYNSNYYDISINDISNTYVSNFDDVKYNPNVIGEIGLDYFRNISTPEEQMHAFEIQLQAAIDLELPVFLHQRDSHDDFLKILRNYHSELSSLVVHCFTGTQRELDEYLELGSYIGLTGWICDERRNQELRASIKNIPLEKLMIETDAPYLIPRNLKPRPSKNINLPKYLPHIAAEISSLTNYSIDEIANETYNNAIKFFNLT